MTIATYIVEGGSSRVFSVVRRKSLEDRPFFQKLINIIIDSVISYIDLQIKSGAEIIKLFDSWSGVLPENDYIKWVVEPNKIIIDKLKELHPDIPIIIFTRGSSVFYETIARSLDADVLAVDQNIPRLWIRDNIQRKYGNIIIQGSLDNVLLASDSGFLKNEVLNILKDFGEYPFIFNLGHGVLPETPIKNIEKVIDIVRSSH